MPSVQLEQINKKNPLYFVIILWVVYAVFYVILRQYNTTEIYAGFLALIGEVGLDIIAVSLAFCLWKRATGQEKTIFALFGISFLLATITDISYNITVNVLGITNYTGTVASVFDIPFLGFLVLQLLAWIIIFLQAKPTLNNRIILTLYLPIAATALAIFGIFFFGFTWKIPASSLKGLYITGDTILQVLSLFFALLCLTTVYNKQIRFISIGYLIIIVSGLLVHFRVLEQILSQTSLLETTWVLGLLLIAFGFSRMLKTLSDSKTNQILFNKRH